MTRRRPDRIMRTAWLVSAVCVLGVAASPASAAVIGFDDQPPLTVLGEQYAGAGVHLGPSPFAGQTGTFTAVARPAQAQSAPNVAALSYDAQTDFSSSWIRFDKPQSRVSFRACRDGGAGDPATPNVNVDAYDATGTQIDNQQGITCTLNGPLVPITVEKPGITFIHVAGTGGSAPPGPGWAIDDLEYAADPPPYVPPATSLAVTAVSPAAPVVAGRPALLSAALTGAAQRIDWDVTGDGKTDVSCPGTQTTLSFRAPAGGARAAASVPTAVTVRAVDTAGTSTSFTQTLTVSAAPTATATVSPALKRVQAAFAKAPAAYACGRAQDLAAATTQLPPIGGGGRAFAELLRKLPCLDKTLILKKTITAATVTVSGCFKPITAADQVPPAELGTFQPVLDIAKLPRLADIRAGKDSAAAILVRRALDFSDAWISSDPVLVNGVKLSPQGAGRIVWFGQLSRLYSADSTLSAGGIRLDAPRAFSLSTILNNPQGRILLGSFRFLPGGLGQLAGFGLTGDLSVVLTRGTGGLPGGAEVRATLKLPPYLSLEGGGSAQVPVTFHLSPTGSLVVDALHIEPEPLELGPEIGLKEVALDYTGATGEWRGTGRLCFSLACINAKATPGLAPPGGVIIRDGGLKYLFARVDFNPSIPLFAGVDLDSIGAGVALDPTRLLGSMSVTAAGIFKINGALAIAFPSSATPYILSPIEVGRSFPAPLYQRRNTTLTMAVGADASIKIPLIDDPVPLGGAYLFYAAPGYVAFGGGIDFSFFKIITVTARADGEFNFANGKFNLHAGGRVCVVDIICAGADANVSDLGVGGCVNVDLGFLGDINIGGGVVYNPFKIVIWPFDGCRWTRFADRAVGARAAQAGQPLRETFKAGDPSRAIELDGADGAPRVRVTTPDGETFESTDGPGRELTKSIRILRSEQLKTTVVGIQDPKAGTYTIERLPTSPAITAMSTAEDPPPASVDATVSDPAPATTAAAGTTAAAAAAATAGARRTLRYDIRRRPGQKVTFVEVGLGGRRTIGTTSGGRGSIRFTPAPGLDKRRIEAQFTLAGLQAETITVARFTPPSPRLGRPASVAVARRGTALRVSWPRVAGATSYDVVVTAASGEQRHRRTAAASITLSGVPRSSGGRVAVRATAPQRQGVARRVRYRATAKPAPTRFGPLPQLRRAR